MAKHPTHLEAGMKAPDFSAIIETGDTISLSDFKGKKLILFFYPKDHTPGCTAQNCNLRDNYSLLREAGYEMLGVSADSAKRHNSFIDKHSLPFHLIADENKEVINAYGVWGEKTTFGITKDGLHRTTFVIDENGIILSIIKKVKTKAHAEQILEIMT